MNDILEWLVTAEDTRQQAKVKHCCAHAELAVLDRSL